MADQEQWPNDANSIFFGAVVGTEISPEIVMGPPHANSSEQYYPAHPGSETQFQDLRDAYLNPYQSSQYISNSQNGCNYSYANLNINMDRSISSPYLKIIEQPVNKYRFRYESEKGSHGGIQGCNSKSQKKTFPTVQLENYQNNRHVCIRASLYTNDEEPILHVHKLIQSKSQNLNGICEVELKEDGIAVFQNLSILFRGKKDVPNILYERLTKQCLQQNCPVKDKKLREEADRLANSINLDYVRICFEAFVLNSTDQLERICAPVFSVPIANKKSPDSGELRISRMDKCSGSCKGNDEVFLLCEKVNKKEIKVRFREVNAEGQEIWKGFGSFTEADVHHQVAIVFKTPPYKNENIRDPVKVQVQLYREKDGEESDSKDFTYIPAEPDSDAIERKRKKIGYDDANQSIMENFDRRNPYFYSLSNNPNLEDHGATGMTPQFFSGSNQGYQSSESRSSLSDSEFALDKSTTTRGLLSTSSDPLLPQMISLPSFHEAFIQRDSAPSDVDSISQRLREVEIKEEERKNIQHEELSEKRSIFDIRERSLARFCLQAFRRFIMSNDLESLLIAMRHLVPIQDEEGDNIIHLAILHQPSNVCLLEHLLNICKGLPYDVLNQRNNKYQTVLHLASVNKYPEVINLLLTYGTAPNVQESKGNTPLHLAVLKDYFENVKELVTFKNYNQRLSSRNVQLDVLNYDGYSPLHLAVKGSKFSCASLLCQAGARVDAKDGTTGHTALHMAVEHSSTLLQFLLEKETADVNAQNYMGNTPLHLACIRNNCEIASQLIKAKADPSIQNFEQNEVFNEGHSAYDFAHSKQMLKIISKSACEVVRVNPPETTEFIETKVYQESQTHDSGFISGSISYLDEKTVSAMSNMLNDPPEWKTLALYMGFDDDKIRNIEKITNDPTKAILKKYEAEGNSKDNLIQVLKMGDFTEILSIVQDDDF